uniref:Small subunit ribosomal protein S6 n=1 Tax=Tetraselmis sp. GSL018 TaxID=582737 RepID=A0A061R2B5_9CHLO|mmetsp:Transcript_23411/g.56021  ORF Transcript_23411/g.56021 Transcript_23411/m.56021 type:complete len:127 (-) Transcript_23411:868-1248(-)|eukprot:CAMPEP_0177598438 /NCGR_PEP_ID=MMETSP0419_2-20121207/12351_1 /TAXON_ID=582737 /ORGANISM="Tetraselmis sp., Strain GSL018" /LENGTH=126 /DNA_ID=CAMNT_0019090887 /DNA_START=898 /DNA_END=1278 /DNA_ORIENTATION=+
MPLYQLFGLAKPSLPLPALASVLQNVGHTVLSSNGVVTDVKSFGQQDLAYDIKTRTGRYTQAQMFLLSFSVPPATLREVDHCLRVDEDVLRWTVVKSSSVERLPRSKRDLAKLRKLILNCDDEAGQ